MKSIKDFALNIQEESYHNLPSFSYSVIAKYAKEGFSAIQNLFSKTEPTPSMQFGSFLDSLITRGIEHTKKEYDILDMSVPESEKKVLDTLASRIDKLTFAEITEDEVDIITKELEYRKSWKADTKYNKLSKYSKYYDLLKSGKKIISAEDAQDAFEMLIALRNNTITKEFMGKSTPDIEYLYQCSFQIQMKTNQFSDKSFLIKIMPDLIKVNHKDKTIRLIDFKTSSLPAWNFKENFIKFRYDIQASLYTDVITAIKEEIPEYKDYTILPFVFVVISRADKIPVAYEYDSTDERQKDGLVFKDYIYKGYKNLLEEIDYYLSTNAVTPKYIDSNKINNLIDILNGGTA